MDLKDKKILKAIQGNARITNAELSQKVGMAPSAMLERVRKLEQKGIIKRYETRLDYECLGLDLTTFIQIRTSEKVGSAEIGGKLAKFPEIQEIFVMAGEYCYLLKARVKNTGAQQKLLKKIGKIQGVQDSVTNLVLETVKETLEVDLGNVEENK